VKLAGDRTFKTNQQWVVMTHGGNKEAAPKWSWYGALFMLVPYGMLSGKQEQYPSVWVCACTKGCRKGYVYHELYFQFMVNFILFFVNFILLKITFCHKRHTEGELPESAKF
jgi:hypothetical protein